MRAEDVTDTLELALEASGCASAHVLHKPRLLSDNGPSYVAGELADYLADKKMRHVRGAPFTADERRSQRRQHSRIIVDDLHQFLEARLRQVSAKSRLSEAIRYALTRWDGLIRFLDDGRLDLDNNAVERAIRPLALNRKNALFAGSDEGGDNWAVIATLIENCKLAGINPHTWLAKTLTKLANGHPISRLEELLPTADVG